MEIEYKSGFLNESGGDIWKVYLYELRLIWYLIVRYELPGKKQYFRLGDYPTKEEAAMKAEAICPWKLGKTQKIGTIDLYRNRTWRVRIKHERENLHIGYYPKPQEAHRTIMKVMNDKEFLASKLSDLLRKRKMNIQQTRRRKAPETWDDKDQPDRKRPYIAGKRRWNDQDISLMMRLRQEMHSWQSIAKRFGRTVEACKSRVWRHVNYNNNPFVKTEPINNFGAPLPLHEYSPLTGYQHFGNNPFAKQPYDIPQGFQDYPLAKKQDPFFVGPNQKIDGLNKLDGNLPLPHSFDLNAPSLNFEMPDLPKSELFPNISLNLFDVPEPNDRRAAEEEQEAAHAKQVQDYVISAYRRVEGQNSRNMQPHVERSYKQDYFDDENFKLLPTDEPCVENLDFDKWLSSNPESIGLSTKEGFLSEELSPTPMESEKKVEKLKVQLASEMLERFDINPIGIFHKLMVSNVSQLTPVLGLGSMAKQGVFEYDDLRVDGITKPPSVPSPAPPCQSARHL